MENVHILTQRISSRGEFLPFSAQNYRNSTSSIAHELAAKLQTSLVIEDVLTIFSKYAKQLLNFSGVQFESASGDIKTHLCSTAHNAYSFNIHTENEAIGQLTYYTKYPLSAAIEQKLQLFHTVLTYPLRNALMYARVLKLATKDALTGLNNRSQFNDVLLQKLESYRRNERPFSLMLLDLDNFKQVNDNFGHNVGDDILKEFASVLCSSVRGTDSVFRFGGDEFAILIEDPALATNTVLAERIMRLVNSSHVLTQYNVTTSIGFTRAQPSDTETDIFSRSDKGLYKAKASGRNCAKSYL